MTVIVAAAALSAPTAAFAQFYIGVSIGQSTADFTRSDFTSAGTYAANIKETPDNDRTGYKLYSGYGFNENIALELGYAHLGKPEYRYALNANKGRNRVKQTAFYVAAKASLPMTDQFSVFAKLGASRNKARSDGISNNDAVNDELDLPRSESETRISRFLGIGAEYRFLKNVAIRAEYEDFGKFGTHDVGGFADMGGVTKAKMFSIGLTYKF
jgi:OOP family OmpA-OmpF porin